MTRIMQVTFMQQQLSCSGIDGNSGPMHVCDTRGKAECLSSTWSDDQMAIGFVD